MSYRKFSISCNILANQMLIDWLEKGLSLTDSFLSLFCLCLYYWTRSPVECRLPKGIQFITHLREARSWLFFQLLRQELGWSEVQDKKPRLFDCGSEVCFIILWRLSSSPDLLRISDTIMINTIIFFWIIQYWYCNN